MYGHFVVLEKLRKENNRSIGKNLPNLVTLFAAHSGKRQKNISLSLAC
jgi:hypothetical protein